MTPKCMPVPAAKCMKEQGGGSQSVVRDVLKTTSTRANHRLQPPSYVDRRSVSSVVCTVNVIACQAVRCQTCAQTTWATSCKLFLGFGGNQHLTLRRHAAVSSHLTNDRVEPTSLWWENPIDKRDWASTGVCVRVRAGRRAPVPLCVCVCPSNADQLMQCPVSQANGKPMSSRHDVGSLTRWNCLCCLSAVTHRPLHLTIATQLLMMAVLDVHSIALSTQLRVDHRS